MATLAGLILDVEALLYGQARLERPRLDSGSLADGSTTSLTGLNTNLWRAQDRAEVAPVDGSVGEIVHIVSETSGTATVIRGMDGTTAAAASSQPLRKNPTHPRINIQKAIEATVDQDLWPHVWIHNSRTLSFTDGDYFYDLAANDRSVITAYQVIDTAFKELPHGWWMERQGIDTTTASTGQMLWVRKVWDSSETVHYWVRTQYTTADYADLEDDVAEAIPYMAAARLIGDYRYSKDQADPNRQALPEAQYAAAGQSSRQLKGEFLRQRESINLRLKYAEKNVRQTKFQNRRPQTRGIVGTWRR